MTDGIVKSAKRGNGGAVAASAPDGVSGRKPRVRAGREALPDTPDAVEIAMTAVASGKPLPDVARKVLEQQAELIKAQVGELRLRAVGEHIRAALWGSLALVIAVAACLIVTVVVKAARSDTLIIQPFDVPPALEAKGLTGKVVAIQVLDKLAELQATSSSSRPAATYANNWTDQIKIEIPNTGATVDQIWALLRGWLGKETRISGEIVETKDGLALAVRVGTLPASRVSGAADSLDALVTQSAELIYRGTQPYRYAIYIGSDPKRWGEGHEILLRLTHDPSPTERKWAYNGLSADELARGNYPVSLAMARRALAIDPKMVPALNNIAMASWYLGHDQEAVAAYESALAAPQDGLDPSMGAANACMGESLIGDATRDPVRLDKGAQCLAASPVNISAVAPYYAAVALIHRHEPARVSFPAESGMGAAAAEIDLRVAIDAGSPESLAAALAAFKAAAALEHARIVYTDPREAALMVDALLALGRRSEASALAATTPLDCYDCVRARGLTAAAAGDFKRADRWFAEAVRQGPKLAQAYLDWGRVQIARKQYAEAEANLARAARFAPNWADPLKARGDLLAAQGRWREALSAYDLGLKAAPRWTALREARAKAARAEAARGANGVRLT
jgi:tetratricopeptide (TPR) repeat protein